MKASERVNVIERLMLVKGLMSLIGQGHSMGQCQ